MQKYKSDNEESDTEAEKVIDEYGGKDMGRIAAILREIFDGMTDLKNEMKKITSENRELRKLAGAWENQWRDEKREIHLKLKLENNIK